MVGKQMQGRKGIIPVLLAFLPNHKVLQPEKSHQQKPTKGAKSREKGFIKKKNPWGIFSGDPRNHHFFEGLAGGR